MTHFCIREGFFQDVFKGPHYHMKSGARVDLVKTETLFSSKDSKETIKVTLRYFRDLLYSLVSL